MRNQQEVWQKHNFSLKIPEPYGVKKEKDKNKDKKKNIATCNSVHRTSSLHTFSVLSRQ